MHKRILLFVPLFTLLITAVVLAQSGGRMTLTWWTIDGGGGRLEGGGLSLEGTAGQPDASLLTGQSLALYGGFWAPSAVTTPSPPTPTPTPTPKAGNCPDTYEPNDDFDQAQPITPGTTVHAYICTEGDRDFYTLNLNAGQKITLVLSNIPSGQDYDLYLDGPNRQDVATSNQSGNVDERIEYTTTVGGPYYIIVTGYSGYSTTQAYSLQVSVTGVGTEHRTYMPLVRK